MASFNSYILKIMIKNKTLEHEHIPNLIKCGYGTSQVGDLAEQGHSSEPRCWGHICRSQGFRVLVRALKEGPGGKKK